MQHDCTTVTTVTKGLTTAFATSDHNTTADTSDLSGLAGCEDHVATGPGIATSHAHLDVSAVALEGIAGVDVDSTGVAGRCGTGSEHDLAGSALHAGIGGQQGELSRAGGLTVSSLHQNIAAARRVNIVGLASNDLHMPAIPRVPLAHRHRDVACCARGCLASV